MSPVFKIPPYLPEFSSPDSSLYDQFPKSYIRMCLFLFFIFYLFLAHYSFIFVAHRNQNSFSYEKKITLIDNRITKKRKTLYKLSTNPPQYYLFSKLFGPKTKVLFISICDL